MLAFFFLFSLPEIKFSVPKLVQSRGGNAGLFFVFLLPSAYMVCIPKFTWYTSPCWHGLRPLVYMVSPGPCRPCTRIIGLRPRSTSPGLLGLHPKSTSLGLHGLHPQVYVVYIPRFTWSTSPGLLGLHPRSTSLGLHGLHPQVYVVYIPKST